jgi:hypothetical protein
VNTAQVLIVAIALEVPVLAPLAVAECKDRRAHKRAMAKLAKTDGGRS